MGRGTSDDKSGAQIRFEVDQDAELIKVWCTGDVTVVDVMAHLEEVTPSPERHPGMNSLIDLTDAHIIGDFGNARQMHHYLRSIQHHIGNCRWAFVVPWDLNFGLIKMIGAISEDLSVSIKGFRSLEEAETWLAGRDET